jgi:hypothetical protein
MISFDHLNAIKIKIFQVAASCSASIFLSENRQILYCGSGGDFNKIKVPTKFDIKKRVIRKIMSESRSW